MDDANQESVQHVRNAHPPVWIMKLANSATRALARTSLGRYLGPVTLLQFDGRRTGRHYAVPVMTHDYDGAMVVFTDARWALNFEGGAAVVVRRYGRTYRGVAQMANAQDAVTALRAVLANLPSPRRVGLVIDKDYNPTDAELNAMRSMIRLDLERS